MLHVEKFSVCMVVVDALKIDALVDAHLTFTQISKLFTFFYRLLPHQFSRVLFFVVLVYHKSSILHSEFMLTCSAFSVACNNNVYVIIDGQCQDSRTFENSFNEMSLMCCRPNSNKNETLFSELNRCCLLWVHARIFYLCTNAVAKQKNQIFFFSARIIDLSLLPKKIS